MQAGLGGGSSNAATMLWGLNALLGRPFSEEQLLSWGGEIGSDIAFFFSRGTAYCTGRGEIIRDLPPLSSQKLSLFKISEGLSTPQVYQNLKLSQLSKQEPEEDLSAFLAGDIVCYNDLEDSAFSLMPMLGEMKKDLSKAGYDYVTMCGSGSAFFGLGQGKVDNPDMWKAEASFHTRSPGYWY